MPNKLATEIARLYRKRYLSALLLIAIMVFIDLLIAEATISNQDDSYRVINISGRQRMLSQRIDAIAANLIFSSSQEQQQTDRDRLREALRLFSDSHNNLLQGNPKLDLPVLDNPVIEEIYFGQDNLDLRVREYLELGFLVLNSNNIDEQRKAAKAIDLRSHSLLMTLDKVVKEHEKAGADMVQMINYVLIIIFLLTLGVLLLIGRFVFEPMSNKLADAIDSQSTLADEMETQRDNLQRLADELTLANVIAEENREKAEKSAEARGRFLAVMSHELRTPLTAIIGFGDLLHSNAQNAANSDSMDSEKVATFTKNISDSGRHLLSIVNDVLDFASFEAGRIDVNNEVFNLHSCFYNIKSMTSSKCREANISLLLQIDPSVPEFVSTDPKRLNQIMFNLVGNAIKFSGGSDISVSVRAESLTSRQMKIHVAVSDSGSGIPGDKLSAIFDPFEQVESGHTRNHGGTGLGLAITKEIVTMMGGEIWAESKVGQGTTMHFSIEAEDVSKLVKAAQMTSTPSGKIDHSGLNGITLLVVDDIQINAETIIAILEPLGVTVNYANSGTEAINSVQNSKPDMIMMDMHMPDMDGKEAAEKIRAMFAESGEDCPPIHAWSADVLHDFEDEMNTLWDGVIEKPVMPDILIRHISSQLG